MALFNFNRGFAPAPRPNYSPPQSYPQNPIQNHMPNPMLRHMQPQPPRRQLPQMNPQPRPQPQPPNQGYHDPSVRFEPYNPQENQPMPQPLPQPTPQRLLQQTPKPLPPQQTPMVAPRNPAAEQNYTVKSKLLEIYAGERNSVEFYTKLLELEDLSEYDKKLITELAEIKTNASNAVLKIYQELIGEQIQVPDSQIADIGDFREALSFALLQESNILRDLITLSTNIGARASTLINSKIADIAYVIAII